MAKHRNVLIISGILLVLVLGIVLSCTLLRAKTFEVQVRSDPAFRVTADCSEATDAFLGKSILFLNVNEVKKEVERKYPYARVDKVEKGVSANVILRVSERYEFFCIRTKNQADEIGQSYIVTDRELKVLRTGMGPLETFDGVDRLVDAVIPEDLLGEAVPGERLTFARQSCSDFLLAFAKGSVARAENEFLVRQTFRSIEYFKEPDSGKPDKAGCAVLGVYGCRFDLSGASESPNAFFDAMFRAFYEEFDTEDRERAEIWFALENGRVVKK